MITKKDYYYLKIVFFIRYFADCMFYSFIALYLSSIGYKEGAINTIMSITTITCLVVNPIWSMIAKNNKISRILLIILSIIEGSLIICYANVDTKVKIMLFTSLMAVAAGPYYNLMDANAVKVATLVGKDYANVRVMGTIAYAVATPFSGILSDQIGFRNVFIISGCLFMLAGLMSIFLKKVELGDKEESKRDYKKILTNKQFLFYLIIYIFVVSLSVIADNNISLLFKNVKGLTTTEYSFVFLGMLICEMLTMILLAKFCTKPNYPRLLFIGGVIYFLRSFMLSFTMLPTFLLISFAILRGVAWGFILFSHIKYLTKIVGFENITTAAILFSVFTNLFTFVSTNAFGYILQHVGYSMVYRVESIIVLLFSIIFIVYVKKQENIVEKSVDK